MLQIQLDANEVATLQKILESYLSDLRVEIGGTESKDFRDALKQEEGFIKKFLRQLEGEPAVR
jgi:hypothetical protein